MDRWKSDIKTIDFIDDQLDSLIKTTDKNETNAHEVLKKLKSTFQTLKSEHEKNINIYLNKNIDKEITSQEKADDFKDTLKLEGLKNEQIFNLGKQTLSTFIAAQQISTKMSMMDTLNKLNESLASESLFDKISSFRKKVFGSKNESSNKLK